MTLFLKNYFIYKNSSRVLLKLLSNLELSWFNKYQKFTMSECGRFQFDYVSLIFNQIKLILLIQ